MRSFRFQKIAIYVQQPICRVSIVSWAHVKVEMKAKVNFMEFFCPECGVGAPLECMVVIGADESYSGKTERLWLCRKCLSTWETETDDEGLTTDPRRYFFG